MLFDPKYIDDDDITPFSDPNNKAWWEESAQEEKSLAADKAQEEFAAVKRKETSSSFFAMPSSIAAERDLIPVPKRKPWDPERVEWSVLQLSNYIEEEGLKKLKTLLRKNKDAKKNIVQSIDERSQQPILLAYIDSLGTAKEKCEFLSCILNTCDKECIQQLNEHAIDKEQNIKGYVWYINNAEDRYGAIDSVFSSRSPCAINTIVAEKIGDCPILSWYIQNSKNYITSIKRVLSSNNSSAITFFADCNIRIDGFTIYDWYMRASDGIKNVNYLFKYAGKFEEVRDFILIPFLRSFPSYFSAFEKQKQTSTYQHLHGRVVRAVKAFNSNSNSNSGAFTSNMQSSTSCAMTVFKRPKKRELVFKTSSTPSMLPQFKY